MSRISNSNKPHGPKSAPTSGTTPGQAQPAVASSPPLSAEQVAAMLGVHRSEVMELVCAGKLPAKRIGFDAFITGANLAAFVANADPVTAFKRFKAGDAVVWMDEGGEHGIGRFVAENPDGTVRVLRDGFWGEYEATFPPTQVQPFTCRVPPNRVQ